MSTGGKSIFVEQTGVFVVPVVDTPFTAATAPKPAVPGVALPGTVFAPPVRTEPAIQALVIAEGKVIRIRPPVIGASDKTLPVIVIPTSTVGSLVSAVWLVAVSVADGWLNALMLNCAYPPWANARTITRAMTPNIILDFSIRFLLFEVVLQQLKQQLPARFRGAGTTRTQKPENPVEG